VSIKTETGIKIKKAEGLYKRGKREAKA